MDLTKRQVKAIIAIVIPNEGSTSPRLHPGVSVSEGRLVAANPYLMAVIPTSGVVDRYIGADALRVWHLLAARGESLDDAALEGLEHTAPRELPPWRRILDEARDADHALPRRIGINPRYLRTMEDLAGREVEWEVKGRGMMYAEVDGMELLLMARHCKGEGDGCAT